MNEIIEITQTQINGSEVNSVNSREIYQYLEVKQEYANWIKYQIDKLNLKDGVDFTIDINVIGKNRMKDYIVTTDVAKNIGLISFTDKGQKIRDYFIEVEKQSKRVLSTSEQIVLLAQGHQETEKRIVALEQTKRLENWQEKSLQDAKNKKVYEIANDDKEFASKLHRKVWSLFKKQFHLPRYNELPAIKYENGLDYISNLTIADMVA